MDSVEWCLQFLRPSGWQRTLSVVVHDDVPGLRVPLGEFAQAMMRVSPTVYTAVVTQLGQPVR